MKLTPNGLPVPNIEEVKSRAKLLAQEFERINGEKLKHGNALNEIARAYGYKDWNVLSAAIKKKEAA